MSDPGQWSSKAFGHLQYNASLHLRAIDTSLALNTIPRLAIGLLQNRLLRLHSITKIGRPRIQDCWFPLGYLSNCELRMHQFQTPAVRRHQIYSSRHDQAMCRSPCKQHGRIWATNGYHDECEVMLRSADALHTRAGDTHQNKLPLFSLRIAKRSRCENLTRCGIQGDLEIHHILRDRTVHDFDYA